MVVNGGGGLWGYDDGLLRGREGGRRKETGRQTGGRPEAFKRVAENPPEGACWADTSLSPDTPTSPPTRPQGAGQTAVETRPVPHPRL